MRSHKMGSQQHCEQKHFFSANRVCSAAAWGLDDVIPAETASVRLSLISLDTDKNNLKCEYSTSTWCVS